MPIGQFLALTTLGSGVWNSIFVGLGYTLGSRWNQVDRYSNLLDYAILAIPLVMIGGWAAKRVHKRRRSASASAETR